MHGEMLPCLVSRSTNLEKFLWRGASPLTPPISPPRSLRLRGSSRGSARRCTSPRFQSQLDLDLDRWSNLKLQTESSRSAVLCQARTSSRHRQSNESGSRARLQFNSSSQAECSDHPHRRLDSRRSRQRLASLQEQTPTARSGV